jgi:hypothetical protein
VRLPMVPREEVVAIGKWTGTGFINKGSPGRKEPPLKEVVWTRDEATRLVKRSAGRTSPNKGCRQAHDVQFTERSRLPAICTACVLCSWQCWRLGSWSGTCPETKAAIRTR